MNRRRFIKAIATGVATVAMTTRMARAAIEVVHERMPRDITLWLQERLDEAAVTGEPVVVPYGEYFVSNTVYVKHDRAQIDLSGSTIRLYGPEFMGFNRFGIDRTWPIM